MIISCFPFLRERIELTLLWADICYYYLYTLSLLIILHTSSRFDMHIYFTHMHTPIGYIRNAGYYFTCTVATNAFYLHRHLLTFECI